MIVVKRLTNYHQMRKRDFRSIASNINCTMNENRKDWKKLNPSRLLLLPMR